MWNRPPALFLRTMFLYRTNVIMWRSPLCLMCLICILMQQFTIITYAQKCLYDMIWPSQWYMDTSFCVYIHAFWINNDNLNSNIHYYRCCIHTIKHGDTSYYISLCGRRYTYLPLMHEGILWTCADHHVMTRPVAGTHCVGTVTH